MGWIRGGEWEKTGEMKWTLEPFSVGFSSVGAPHEKITPNGSDTGTLD